MSVGARAHLTALVALFVLLKAVAYFLDRRALLLEYNSGTELWGAGYTDINAVLPAKEILTYISIVVAIAILVFSNAGMRNLVWAGASLALLGIAAVAIGGIYPLVVQQFTVKPNLRDKEAEYIGKTIDYTRQAYGIANVERTQYTSQNETPPASLVTDQTVVPTIRLLGPGRGQRHVHAVPADPIVLRLPRQARRRPIHDRWPASGLCGRRPGDQLLEADRAADELAEPAHGVHPRVRLRRRAGEHDL